MGETAAGNQVVVETDRVYAFEGVDTLRTPALLIYPALVDANIRATIALLGGEVSRWRPHVKTSKLAFTMRRLAAHGVRRVKCATTLELQTACESGLDDVMLAYPAAPAHVARVRELARAWPHVALSAIVEDPAMVSWWSGSKVGVYIDLDVGMHRTGLDVHDVTGVVALARAIVAAGLDFRGLHGYDGHASSLPAASARASIHAAYDALARAAVAVQAAGIPVGEVITAGTPAFPLALSYRGFDAAGLSHRVSPGTLVYCDATSLAELPVGYRPAALVLTTIVSQPAARRVTCDAGHKTVSADAGVPTCAVVGRPGLAPAKPSEEHLPLDVDAGAVVPPRGERLFLVPRHVCPTVNNFDHAVIVEDGRIAGIERVTARGRDVPVSVASPWSA